MAASSGTGSEGKPPAQGKGPAWMGTSAPKGSRGRDPQWKPSAPKRHDPEARQRAIRTLVAVAATLLLVGFLYYLLTRPEATPLVALRASAYPLQMPPLALAVEDTESLRAASPLNVRVMPVEFESSTASLEKFRETLKSAGRQFNPLRRGSNLVMVYVAAHGAVDEQGRPCLVPPAADPFDSQTWLPLSQVFAALHDEPALQGKAKLLLLDCQRVASCWRCGWLENRFADELGQAVKAASDQTLYVLSAAGPGQLGWPAPELGGSVFGHFLAYGLSGDASGSRGSVSLPELFRYVGVQVEDYTQRRRGVRQQPTLWHGEEVFQIDGAGRIVGLKGEHARIDDVTLAYVDRSRRRQNIDALRAPAGLLSEAKRLLGNPIPDKVSADSGASSYTLNQVWQRYRQRRQPAARGSDPAAPLPGYCIDPVAWASVEQRLAAIGERLYAGKQYQGPALQAEIDRLAKDLGDDQQWAVQGSLPKLDLLQMLRSDRSESRASDARSEENLLETYLKAEPDKRAEAVPRGTSRSRLIHEIYQALTDTSRSSDARNRLTKAVEFLQQFAPSSTSADLIEAHFLTLLDRGLAPGVPLSATHLATALVTRESAERAANPADLRGHYAVESLVNAADDMRRKAEDLLFLADVARPFEGLWSESQGDAKTTTGFQAAIARGERLAESWRLRDEVWADLPLLAEWHFVRARLGMAPQTTGRLTAIVGEAVELDDCLERILRSRDESGTFGARMERAERAYASLSQHWRELHAELERVYELPTNIEQAYRRAADACDAELALHWPPLVGASSQLLERYYQTLSDWSKQSLAAATRTREDSSAAKGSAGDSAPESSRTSGLSIVQVARSDQYDFLRELHRALGYQFVDPYDQHRHATQWDEKQPADQIFRSERGGQEPAWKQAKNLLNAYNDAIAKESPTWSASQRAVEAGARLRQWDRRVRVASPWLSCFQPDLRRPTQPTPARWLQQYDAAHLTAWHAFRAAGDFWGNGQPAANSTMPFFAEAIQRCDAALPNPLRPIQYDIPADEKTVDFAVQAPRALQSLAEWNPIQFPRGISVANGAAGESKLDIALQPITADNKELRLPTGLATLSFAPSPDSAGSAARFAFDPAGRQRTQEVKLPLTGNSPFVVAAYVQREGQAIPSADARLWYRGHVRTKPCPLGASSQPYVAYEFERRPYAAPTVEVQGKDTVRGAVLFIFDCSASMRDADGRFAEAKRQLQDVLVQLAADAGPDLHVGLRAYGKRTKAYRNNGDPELYYSFSSHPDKAPLLTVAGEQMRRERVDQFFKEYPHPDRDVEELVRVADGTPASVKARVNELREEQCKGCTPLYYAITQAMRSGFSGIPEQAAAARQIVVVSDGVNMPYDSTGNSIRPTGLQVNDGDLRGLQQALQTQQGAVRVSVVLFAGELNPVGLAQRTALDSLEKSFPNAFQVIPAPGPRQIAASILASLPKASIELRSNQAGVAAQPMEFYQPQDVKDWGNDGLLHKDLDRRSVRLKLPGESRNLEQEVELLGGERVVLKYDAREARLLFSSDDLKERRSRPAPPPVTEGHRLLLDALDPDRIGTTIQTIHTFHFRLRDEQQERRHTPRPRYVWLEVKPLGGQAEAAALVFPCIDPIWSENINFPRLQVPVEHWPECPTARVQAWFRYDDPVALHRAKIARDQSGQTLALAPDKWRVEQTGGEGGAARKITVTWRPNEPQPGVGKLLERAVWLWPPPDLTRRRFALDGTEAIHEFTYSRPQSANADLELLVVSRVQFQQGAYYAECEFDVAN